VDRGNEDLQVRLIDWVEADSWRMNKLRIAASLELADWCIAVGFVRNLAWDRLHGYEHASPLSDIDLVYFDRATCDRERDEKIEARLNREEPATRWSVRNQARMHLRNGDPPYGSTEDAMHYWPEIETAVGVRFDAARRIEIVSPFGLASLFDLRITHNPKRAPDVFARRVAEKRWLSIWPRLTLADEK
jgi:uncharacterized protein